MSSQTEKLVNPVKERMRAGGVALGMPIRLGRSGDIARIAKATGHDFIFIDGQHSLFNLETIGNIASTALACGIAPLVRVRGIDDPDVSLLLDNGVMGIVYPDVSTAAQARKAVEICKFAPVGLGQTHTLLQLHGGDHCKGHGTHKDDAFNPAEYQTGNGGAGAKPAESPTEAKKRRTRQQPCIDPNEGWQFE